MVFVISIARLKREEMGSDGIGSLVEVVFQ